MDGCYRYYIAVSQKNVFYSLKIPAQEIEIEVRLLIRIIIGLYCLESGTREI